MNFIFRPQPQQIPCYAEQKNLIKSHHFCLKVLTAMYELQSGNSLYNGGIKSKDIIRYMQEKFDLDGDVKTQIHISLQQSLAYGYITKENGKYKLVGPMAKVIQEPQDSEERYNEIDRVVKIFWSARRFTSGTTGKIAGKEATLNLDEEDEDMSGSETMYPVRKRRRSRRRSRSRETGSTSQTESTNISKFSSRGDIKRRFSRKRGRKRRSSTPPIRRTKSTSRSRSRSRKRRGGKRKKQAEKSNSELLLQSCDPDCTDPDCTCN